MIICGPLSSFCVYCNLLGAGRLEAEVLLKAGVVGEGLEWDPHSWDNYQKLYIVLDSVL
jgi:hypothetical protein